MREGPPGLEEDAQPEPGTWAVLGACCVTLGTSRPLSEPHFHHL